MFDRHTDEVMFNMVNKFLTMLCPNWRIRLIGLASDGARNMTSRVAGIVTRLDATMHDDCLLTRIWCGAHQLDLVMEHIMNDVKKTFLHYHDQFHHSYNLPTEVNRGYEHNVPPHYQPMAIDREGY